MNETSSSVLAYAVLAFLAVAAVWLVNFSPVADLSFSAILLIIPGCLIGLIARAYSASIPLRAESIHPSTREWLGLGVYAFLADQVLPFKSGLALRALYLKNRYNLSYTTFAGLQGGMNLLALWTTAAFGLTLVLSRFEEHAGLAAPYAVAMAILIIPLFGKPTARRGGNRVFKGLANAYNSFNRLKAQSVILVRVLLVTVVLLCANVLAMYFSLQSFGSQAGLYAASLTVASIRLLNLVSITPGNLGIQEFAAAAVLSHLGAEFDDGVLASLIARAVGAALLLAMAPFFRSVVRGVRPGIGKRQN